MFSVERWLVNVVVVLGVAAMLWGMFRLYNFHASLAYDMTAVAIGVLLGVHAQGLVLRSRIKALERRVDSLAGDGVRKPDA